MHHQFAGGGLSPVEFAQGFETALTIDGHVPVYGRLGDARQACGLRVHQSLAEKPEDFHPLLHARVGMVIAFLEQRLLIGFRKS